VRYSYAEPRRFIFLKAWIDELMIFIG
jgi:hypothetical protein